MNLKRTIKKEQCNSATFTIKEHEPMNIDGDFKLLYIDGLPVIGIIEKCVWEQTEIYYPANYLLYVEKGLLRLDTDDGSFLVRAGEFILIRKYTKASYQKLPEENQNGFREILFVFYDDFIRETIRSFPVPDSSTPGGNSIVQLPSSPVLLGLMRSLEVYVNSEVALDRQLLILKTREALHGLLQAKPELIHTFVDFARPEKADLLRFMEHNFTRNLPLEQYARLSGRSLATFNRDFRKLFNSPPYQWVKEQRLHLAKRLLTYTPMNASSVYLEVGFEDLAHFSRSFKKFFGINPSEVSKELTS